MLMLLAALALGTPLDPPERVCLTAPELRARILEPLHALERCQREVEIVTDERDQGAELLDLTLDELDAQRTAAVAAEQRTKRARRGQVRAAGAGGGAVLAVVLVILVLL